MTTPNRSFCFQGPWLTAQCFRLLTFLFLLLAAAMPSVASAKNAPVKFDIPAQSAATALPLFIKQSSVQLMFVREDLKDVNTNAVAGLYEPPEALELMLKGTGLVANAREKGWFSIVRAKAGPATTGSVKGSLVGEGGRGLPDVFVAVRETAQSVSTDQYGQYYFPNLVPGTYVLVATTPGYQPMHITDVRVRAGGELTLGREEMHKPLDEVTKLDPIVVHADTVEELDKILVSGSKEKPFTGANMDIPRTIDDVQPYYIFDAKTIDQSGAVNIEDFLKQRLTMNTTAQTNAQISGQSIYGNTSSVNLRGLGADKTLILVDGRRMAGVNIGGYYQPDVNGIPLSAIDRIEVLPSSASGIYGGSAIGGVVNIILKKDYAGGEIRATYDNTWNTDSPTRTVSASYGFALEGGKTHVMLNASWSDATPLLLQNRRGIFEQNLTTILRNSPSWIYTSRTPFLGALPNITAVSRSQTTLTLQNGVVLPSRNTYIAAGTSANTTNADLYASLAANSGVWNLELPFTTQSPTGLLQPFGATPETKSLTGSVRRQMLPKLEMFADYSYTENNTKSVYNPFSSFLQVPVDSPVNPFTTAVRVRGLDTTQVPVTAQSISRGFTVGAIAQLPWKWTGEFDYSWSDNRFKALYYTNDFAAQSADLESGVLNPFVDTSFYPLNLKKYLVPYTYAGASTLNDFALRGSGPLPSLPWGTPNLTFGLEHRIAGTPESYEGRNYPLTPIFSYLITYFGRQQTTDSGYGELTIPLLKPDWLPLVHALDLQLSGRSERYTVDTGSSGHIDYLDPSRDYYFTPTSNGQPYFSKTSYTSTNGTVGLKYQPAPGLTLRASLATAFLPPEPYQLVKNPQVDSYTTTIIDPKTGSSVDVSTISGGNPDLKPQTSKSLNAGIIWEPRWSLLNGLRLDAEYYRIEQDNYIDSLDAQTIANQESTYRGRVTRDASGTITLVDTSYVNLYKRVTEGWDLSADYTLKTGVGTFNLRAAESIILHLKNQYAQTLPEYDSVTFPSEGGAAKFKSNATLTWEWRNWSAGWTTRYFSSYKQYGAAGGPDSVQNYNGATDMYYIAAQGGDTIPSQTYHDVLFGYAFGKRRANSTSRFVRYGMSALDGVTVQLGVRNVFNKAPPFDAYYNSNYYLSPYGDMRLRSYWLTLKKTF